MTNITYITNYFNLFSRGADEVCVMNTVSALGKTGADINLFIPNFNKFISEDKFASIYKYYDVENTFKLNLSLAKRFYSFGFIGRAILKISVFIKAFRSRSDIYIVRQLELALFFGFFNIPVVFSHHDAHLLQGKPLFRYWVKLLNRKNSNLGMMCVAHNSRKMLISNGVPAEKILVAPNGVNLDKYRNGKNEIDLKKTLSIDNKTKIVCFSGSMYKGRGVKLLLESAKSHPELAFVLIGGTDEDQARLKIFAKKLNLSNVHFLGFVEQDMLPAYLLKADILIMPSTSLTPHIKDMSAMKMFEYLAVGKPIVATNFPVMQEVLTHKETAILVEPDSADAISKGIDWIIENPDLAKKIGNQAKVLSNLYTWDIRAEKIIYFTTESLKNK